MLNISLFQPLKLFKTYKYMHSLPTNLNTSLHDPKDTAQWSKNHTAHDDNTPFAGLNYPPQTTASVNHRQTRSHQPSSSANVLQPLLPYPFIHCAFL